MWDAIDEGQFNNAIYSNAPEEDGDIGVAQAYDLGRRGRVFVILGFGSDLDELSRALRVRLEGPMKYTHIFFERPSLSFLVLLP